MVHLHLPHLGGSHSHHHGRREGGAAAAAAAAAQTTTPKGWVAIRVGREGEEQQRFVVPVAYLNHPLFMGLLKEAEEEYGFEQKGAITIPCHVEYFRRVQGIIDRDSSGHVSAVGGHHHHHHNQQQQHHHHNHFHLCFKA